MRSKFTRLACQHPKGTLRSHSLKHAVKLTGLDESMVAGPVCVAAKVLGGTQKSPHRLLIVARCRSLLGARNVGRVAK